MLSSYCDPANWSELCRILVDLDMMRLSNPMAFWLIVIFLILGALGLMRRLFA